MLMQMLILRRVEVMSYFIGGKVRNLGRKVLSENSLGGLDCLRILVMDGWKTKEFVKFKLE
jgi:hypothetical protein